jgi:thermitase
MKNFRSTFILSILTVATMAVTANASALKKNYPESLLQNKFSSWGINPLVKHAHIHLDKSWKRFEKKQDVVVAVIDTGIEHDHPHLSDNIFVPAGNISENNFGLDFSEKTTTKTPFDTHGHGTHVAGIIKSIFPEVKILALKYYNPEASGQANLEATIRALKYAVDQNVDIINYSGGGPEPSEEELKILKEAEKKGILVVAAAGNEESDIDNLKNAYYPASYGLSNTITVNAYNENLKIIQSSNYGKLSIDVAAPGHRIRSSIPGGGRGYMTGTSQATAFVTGVAALLKAQFPSLSYEHIKKSIVSASDKVKNFEGKVLGAGKLNAEKSLITAERVAERIRSTFRRSLAKTQ